MITFLYQPLNSIRYLKLVSPGRFDILHSIEYDWLEEIDPHMGQIGAWNLGRFHQPDYFSALVQLSHAKPFRMADLREQNRCIGSRASEAIGMIGYAVAE